MAPFTRPSLCSLTRRAVIVAATALTPLAAQAQQAQTPAAIYPIVADASADPLLANLAIPANAAQAGMWSQTAPWPIVAIHTAMLPDGRILTLGAAQGGTAQDGRTLVFWDPHKGLAAGAFQILPNAQNVDSFCSSATLLSDGRLLTSGGASYSSAYSGRESMVVDWKTSAPTRDYDLTAQRWYGTMTKLPDGRAIITGGGAPYTSADPNRPDAANDVSSTPEIYTPGQGWRSLIGAYSTDAFGAKNARWWYPRQWVSPAGTLFGISTDKIWELRFDGNGAIRTIANFKTPPDLTSRINSGPTSTAVMYDTGKILQVGGGGYYNAYDSLSSANATLFDITGIAGGQVTVTEARPMNAARQWATSTVLPDGRVVVTGGTGQGDRQEAGVYSAETWDPATGNWTVGAASTNYRSYHSSALLLLDGAVLVAGGGVPGPVNNLNADVYYPAYLFARQGNGSVLAARPQIVSLSKNAANYGDAIQLQTGGAGTIREVSLIATGAVTHSFNSNQRRMKLAFAPIANGISVAMPASPNLAPPGYYELSVVNTAGVPSTATIVAIGAAAPSTGPAPGAPNPIQIGNDIATIAAAADGTLATANIRNQLWVSQMGSGWTMLPGQFVDAAAIAVNRYYAVGTDGLVYRWNGAAWKAVGRATKRIAAAADGTVAVINDPTGAVWVKSGDDETERWSQVPGAYAKRIALVNRGSLYFIGTDNNVWRSDMVNAPVMVGHNVTAIAASAGGSVTVVSADGSLWRKASDDTTEAWTPLGVTAVTVATPDAARLVYGNAAGVLFSR